MRILNCLPWQAARTFVTICIVRAVNLIWEQLGLLPSQEFLIDLQELQHRVLETLNTLKLGILNLSQSHLCFNPKENLICCVDTTNYYQRSNMTVTDSWHFYSQICFQVWTSKGISKDKKYKFHREKYVTIRLFSHQQSLSATWDSRSDRLSYGELLHSFGELSLTLPRKKPKKPPQNPTILHAEISQ